MENFLTFESQAFKKIQNRQRPFLWTNPPKGTKKPIWSIFSRDQWLNEPCFCIGGGPSLIGFDYEKLKNKGRIIACNKSFVSVPWAEITISMDRDYYFWLNDGTLGPEVTQAFKKFQGIKLWIDSNNTTYNGIFYIHRNQDPGLQKNLRNGIYTGNNTGVGALTLAYALGCNPIYLLGYDGKHQGKKTHHHSGYPRKQYEGTAQTFVKHFKMIAPLFEKKNVQVINLNPKSAIRCFPRKTFEEVF